MRTTDTQSNFCDMTMEISTHAMHGLGRKILITDRRLVINALKVI